jgi:hypothetical protein
MDNAKANIIGRIFINTNYNQSICIVEGSRCKITENTISKSLRQISLTEAIVQLQRKSKETKFLNQWPKEYFW